jgi:cytochrome bd-type quinol oxidase subunit 2
MNTNTTSPKDKTFSEYYVMMLSVLHGLVLGAAAYGLSILVMPGFSSEPEDMIWLLSRWIVSFMFEIFTAWKYIVGATELKWDLNPLDVAIPSLLGIAISASFIAIKTPVGWLLMIITANFFGMLAGFYALYKTEKFEFDDSKKYRQGVYFNIAGGFLVISISILWLLLNEATIVWSSIPLLLVTIFMLRSELK